MHGAAHNSTGCRKHRTRLINRQVIAAAALLALPSHPTGQTVLIQACITQPVFQILARGAGQTANPIGAGKAGGQTGLTGGTIVASLAGKTVGRARAPEAVGAAGLARLAIEHIVAISAGEDHVLTAGDRVRVYIAVLAQGVDLVQVVP